MDIFFRRKRRLENEENCETPCCEKIRSFLASSMEKQMFYANVEGIYKRRIFDIKDSSFLMEYVYSTLYQKEDANISLDWNMIDFKQNQELNVLQNLNSLPGLSGLSKEKLKHIQEICEKINCVSKKFKWVDEIHLCSIWIYYLDYKDNKEKATPLFKIYEKKEGDAAAFLDVNLTVYDNWNCYLDTTTISKSFLCVPRHGTYSFVGEQLDLEFICKTSLQTHYNKFEDNNFKPFSQIAISSWLKKLRLFRHEVQEKVICIATALLNRLRNSFQKLSFTTLAIFCVLYAVELVNFYNSSIPFNHKIQNCMLMLFNIQRRFHSIEDFIVSEVESRVDVSSLSCPDYPSFKELVQKLIRLSGQIKKNWREIFEVIFTILRKCRPALTAIEIILKANCQSTVVLSIFQVFLSILKLEHFAVQETSPVKKHPPGDSSSPENSLLPVHSYGNEAARKVVTPEVLRTFLQKWDLLEKIPVDSVENLILEELEVGSHSLENSEPSPPIPITIVDDFAVLYFPMLSIPTLNRYCLHYIGPNAQIRPIGEFDTEVTNETGDWICRLHFISDFSALGIVKVSKNEKIKLLEGLEDMELNKRR